MPPLLSPNLKVFGLKTRHCALTREKTLLKRKTGKNLRGNFGAEALHRNKILKIYKCYKWPSEWPTLQLNPRHV
jgi:hypothetical protein